MVHKINKYKNKNKEEKTNPTCLQNVTLGHAVVDDHFWGDTIIFSWQYAL